MSDRNIHKFKHTETGASLGQSGLTLILYSNSDNTYHPFTVPAKMTVAAFLDLAMAKLSEGDGAERVEALKRYYQPVLEIQTPGGEHELPPNMTLADAGIENETVCRIAARPLKERLMFCSYG